MKLSYKSTILCAIAVLALVGATTVRAEDAPTPPLNPPMNRPGVIKARIEDRLEQNKEVRNNLLEKRVEGKLASTTKEMRKDMREDIKDMRKEMHASTTMFKKEARMEMKKKMEAREFEIRKTALVRELTKSLEVLTDASTRILSRISKAESEGRTMTEPRTLLTGAMEKLAKAKTEVAAFASLNVSTTTVTASTTVEVDLVKPRQAGDAAIKAVKDARDALQKVVVAIAHNMGTKNVQVTASTTATTTTP